MTRTCASHHVRCDSSRRVASAARGVLGCRALVSEPRDGWVSLWDEACCEGDASESTRVAAELSRRLHAACVTFLIESDGALHFWLHDAGELVDHYDSRTAGTRPAAEPKSGDDALLVAGYCMEGTDPDDVRDVLDAEPDFEQDRVEALAELLGIEGTRATLSYSAIAAGAEGGGEPAPAEEEGEPEPVPEPPPPLHAAARAGDSAALSLLLTEGAEPDGRDSSGRTALHHAAESLAIDYGRMEPGPRREWWRRNAEARAAALEREEEPARAWERERRLGLDDEESERGLLCADALLRSGADVDARDEQGRRPLHAAAGEGHQAVLRALLAAGADPGGADADGRTPLHAAAEWGWDHVIADLLEAGATPDPADSWGWSPLMLAAEGGYEEAVRRLLAAGADPRRENAAGRSVAGVASDAGRRALAAFLREL